MYVNPTNDRCGYLLICDNMSAFAPLNNLYKLSKISSRIHASEASRTGCTIVAHGPRTTITHVVNQVNIGTYQDCDNPEARILTPDYDISVNRLLFFAF